MIIISSKRPVVKLLAPKASTTTLPPLFRSLTVHPFLRSNRLDYFLNYVVLVASFVYACVVALTPCIAHQELLQVVAN
jgi:hypothetical protein